MLDINLYNGFQWIATLDVRLCDDFQLTLRHNQISEASITMSTGRKAAAKAALFDRGTRLTVDLDGRRLFNGPLTQLQGNGPTVSGSLQVTFQSDLRLMDTMLLYPCPEQTPTQYATAAQAGYSAWKLPQTSRGEQQVTGPSETILKTLVANNAGRFPGLQVAPDLGRGSTHTVQVRMTTLAEEVMPLIEADGLGLSVTQVDNGLLVDVYETSVFPHDLSEIGGTVQSWTRTLAGPTATRIVVGGQGDMTARSFVIVQGDSQENVWHWPAEAFVDDTSSGTTDALVASGVKAMGDAAMSDGISVKLAEGKNFRFGDNVWLGDRIEVELPGATISEVLREVDLQADRGLNALGEPQLSVTPVVGDLKSSSFALYRAVRNIAYGLRSLGRH